MKWKIVCLIFALIFVIFMGIFHMSRNEGTDYESMNFIVNSVNLIEYVNENGIADFHTKITVTNTSNEDKFFYVKGDFEKENKLFMIKERILVGYEFNTGYTMFFLPANSYTVFDVSFSANSYKNRKKTDRLPPKIIIEEINGDEVPTDEVVTNISMKDDGAIIVP